MRVCLGLLPLAVAMGQTPSFRADSVLDSGAGRQVALAPGMLISIYGEHLGPISPCTANADPRRMEPPNPARTLRDPAVYPPEVCGVQVFLAGIAAGLLYVSDKQINFKTPLDLPADSDVELKVIYRGRAHAINVRVGSDSPSLSVEGEARVGAPVWIHLEMPYGWGGMVQYPVRIQPGDFGCNEFEVRHNGSPLPRIVLRTPAGGISFSGSPCGHLGFDRPVPHTGRLPLHLQYRFAEPGLYEVRYTYRRMDYPPPAAQIVRRSEWTPIHVLPRPAGPHGTRPAPYEPEELVSDYLPSVIGFADAAGLNAVVRCLYDAHPTVRRYAGNALLYWPKNVADARVDSELAARGPSDATVAETLARHPEMVSMVLPYLKSENRALLEGAVTGVSRWVYAHSGPPAVESPLVETALIDAAEHVIRTGDEQTIVNYAGALGSIRDPRAGILLWDFVTRGVAKEQAAIAIAWRKDPRDLPRLAALVQGPVTGDRSTGISGSGGQSSLPYVMHNAYGTAALPYLESALKKSGYTGVRTNCARELILAGRASGFAFVAQAIEQKAPYAREMTLFVQERFPGLRSADDATVLTFLKNR